MPKLTDGIADYLIERNKDHTQRVRQVLQVQPRQLTLPFVSVDDHLCEPPDIFAGRLPARLQDLTPRMVHG